MTNEEAKELYISAIEAFEAKDYENALSVFDQLDSERPNSRHVTYHRIICLANLGRKHEAKSNLEKLEGKLNAEKIAELKSLLDPPNSAPSESDTGANAAQDADGDNILVIESAFPKSLDETTITGHIKSGTFRTGDSLTIVTSEGMPIVAPIARIGTAETPLKMARAGQKVIMLLQVEPNYVVPGSSATSISQEESYAETMVAGSGNDSAPPSTASELDGGLLGVDRQIRGGDHAGALEKLQAHIAAEPESCAAHRLLAKAYLEGGETVRDAAKALEHVRKAYELGGADDPVVVDLLAQAMAENGEAKHGLRFLERLYTGTNEFAAKGALGQRIIDFRTRYELGHSWEFSDTYGDVIFESGDIQEIVRAIKSNTVPKTSLCKKDRIGEWRKVEEAIAREHEAIGALFKEEKGGSKNSMVMYIIIALLAAIIVAVLMMNIGGTGPELEVPVVTP
jgi:tetratricopeptide (TPR) repeat protein